jgi:DNA-binding XRE family transcriptional regulator
MYVTVSYIMKKTSYAHLIKFIREERNLSQAQVAQHTHMSRASYVAVEKGTKELSLAEASSLTKLFGISLDALLETEVPNVAKYHHMLLAFLRAAKKSKQSIKKTKLAKLLYIADFSWYYLTNKSMSGVQYRRGEFGPVADVYFRLLDDLEQNGTVTIKQIYRDDYHMYEIEETRGSSKKTLSLLNTKEMKHLEKIWTAWAGASTAEIVKFTVEQTPFQTAIPNEIIAYASIRDEASHMIF